VSRRRRGLPKAVLSISPVHLQSLAHVRYYDRSEIVSVEQVEVVAGSVHDEHIVSGMSPCHRVHRLRGMLALVESRKVEEHVVLDTRSEHNHWSRDTLGAAEGGPQTAIETAVLGAIDARVEGISNFGSAHKL